jgi:hypothetical protein
MYNPLVNVNHSEINHRLPNHLGIHHKDHISDSHICHKKHDCAENIFRVATNNNLLKATRSNDVYSHHYKHQNQRATGNNDNIHWPDNNDNRDCQSESLAGAR